jgi:uncharacterized membrane protein YfcA
MINTKNMDVVTIILLIITGLMAGFLGGLVGVGGGIVMVPMLVYALHLPQLTAQGISLSVLMIPVSSLAVFNYYKAGHLTKEHILYTLLIAAFFAVGTYIASKIVVSIDPKIVKKGFAVFMVVVAIKMLFEK